MAKSSLPWGRLAAEGLVIIAGVLIALAADRWVQAMDEREEGAAYLARLSTEFQATDSILVEATKLARVRQARAQLVAEVLSGRVADSVSAGELVLAMSLAHWLQDPEVPREAWAELLATGRLGLIASDQLRTEVAEFYRLIDQQAEFHLEWIQFVQPYRAWVNSVLSPELQLAIAKYRLDREPLPEDLVPARGALLTRIAQASDVEEVLGDVLVTNYAGQWMYSGLAEQAARIAELIQLELDRS